MLVGMKVVVGSLTTIAKISGRSDFVREHHPYKIIPIRMKFCQNGKWENVYGPANHQDCFPMRKISWLFYIHMYCINIPHSNICSSDNGQPCDH